ncbi:MAG: hypothetical protein ACLSUW_08190 [Akkermansia sp.]
MPRLERSHLGTAHPMQKEQYFEYMRKHVFSYARGYDPAWKDPNMDMMA